MSAYDPKRTLLGLALLGECRPNLVSEPFSGIVKAWRRIRSGDRAFEQNSAEALALGGRDGRSTALLPLEDDGGLGRASINRPAHRNGTTLCSQGTMLGSVCRLFMHDKCKTLSGIRIEENFRPVNENASAEARQRISDDLRHQSPSCGTFDDQILCFGQSMKPIKKRFTSLTFS